VTRVEDTNPKRFEPSARGVDGLPAGPAFDVDEVMRRVRAEVARRHSGNATNQVAGSGLQRLIPDAPGNAPRHAHEFGLLDLLALPDTEFVEAAYQTLLRRAVDEDGRSSYLNALRNGELTRVEVLGALRWSAEGRQKSIRMPGLRARYVLARARRIPVLGRIASWSAAFLLLSRSRYRINLHDARLDQLSPEINNRVRLAELEPLQRSIKQIDERASATDEELRQARARVEELRSSLEVLTKRIDAADQRFESEVRNVVEAVAIQIEGVRAEARDLRVEFSRIDELAENLPSAYQELRNLSSDTSQLRRDTIAQIATLRLQLATQRFASVELQRRFGLLFDDVRDRLPGAMDGGRLKHLAAEESHRLDEMYASFEEHFRGAREDIANRARHYLPIVADAHAGSDDAPVLDLGCGRGEWLSLLRDNGMQACGVDLNQVFLADCRAQGLNVVDSDALNYLRELPDASIGAITSMHLVEHLPLETVINLIDESFRVLGPGGVIALETPNPENLLVGSHYFYLDPTHRNPLPPVLLQWLVQSRGFVDVQIDRLSEGRGEPEIYPVPDDVPGAEQINKFVSLVCQPPDYAVVARKGSSGPS